MINATVVAVGSRNISVVWSDPIYHGNGLDGYEVEYEAHGTAHRQPVDFGQRNAVVTGLYPYTVYTVKVRAKSFSGTGPASEPMQATTLDDSEY